MKKLLRHPMISVAIKALGRNRLQTGLTMEGDLVAETMGEVVQNTTSQLTSADQQAMVAYLRSVPAMVEEKH